MLNAMTCSYLGAMVKTAGIRVVLPSGFVLRGPDTGTITLTFYRWRDVFRVVCSPSVGLAELYAEQRISIDGGDILDLVIRLMDPAVEKSAPRAMHLTTGLMKFLQPLSEGWSARISRRNVSHHYDLGNDLYGLFLDQDWQYSCAYFDEDGISIDEAQRRKKDHIARKLRLGPEDSVLDIGSGWGGMALHLSGMAKSVKGITLSEQQLEESRNRAKATNADVSFELKDYRHEKGKFDRVVSVGMLEHVGKQHYGNFFHCVSRCLNQDGLGLIHTIGRPNPPNGTDRFIRKYIFPGGYLPSLSQLTTAIEQTDLVISDIEVLFLHYAETLLHWRKRFLHNRQQAVELKDEYFARIWEFYLAASEAAFRNGNLVVFQIQVKKPGAKPPATRDYIYS